MTRLRNKCLLASAALHGLLCLLLFAGAGFLRSAREPVGLPTVTFIPARLVEAKVAPSGPPAAAPNAPPAAAPPQAASPPPPSPPTVQPTPPPPSPPATPPAERPTVREPVRPPAEPVKPPPKPAPPEPEPPRVEKQPPKPPQPEPEPPRVEKQPPEPVKPEPEIPRVEPKPKPKPEAKPPKPRAAKKAPAPVTPKLPEKPPVQDPPKPKDPAPKRTIEPNLTPAVRTLEDPQAAEKARQAAENARQAKEKLEAEARAQAEAEARARVEALNRARDEALARAREAADARRALVAGSISGLRNRLSGGTDVSTLGEGSESYAGYAEFVRAVYDWAWRPPEDVAEDATLVKVKVTIARDGRILSTEVLSRSGIAALDKSVRAALDRVDAIGQTFPEGAREEKRAFIINFNLKAKRGLG